MFRSDYFTYLESVQNRRRGRTGKVFSIYVLTGKLVFAAESSWGFCPDVPGSSYYLYHGEISREDFKTPGKEDDTMAL